MTEQRHNNILHSTATESQICDRVEAIPAKLIKPPKPSFTKNPAVTQKRCSLHTFLSLIQTFPSWGDGVTEELNFPCEMVFVTPGLPAPAAGKGWGRGSAARSLRRHSVTNGSREPEQSDAALERHRGEQSHLFDRSCLFFSEAETIQDSPEKR